MLKSASDTPPHKIVEDARRYITENIGGDLRPRTIAKEIGVHIQELHGSYESATITTLEIDILKIKIHSLFEDIKNSPGDSAEAQATRNGLIYGEELEKDFESEFWISIADHRQNSAKYSWQKSAQSLNAS